MLLRNALFSNRHWFHKRVRIPSENTTQRLSPNFLKFSMQKMDMIEIKRISCDIILETFDKR